MTRAETSPESNASSAISPGSSSLDSNIFLYAFLGQDERKQSVARDLVNAAQAGRHSVALQVMGEVFNRLRRPDAVNAAMAEKLVLQEFAPFALQGATPTAFAAAMRLSARTGRQFWDSLIIATCAEHGVETLYTEEQGPEPHTALGVRLVNPFADLKAAVP